MMSQPSIWPLTPAVRGSSSDADRRNFTRFLFLLLFWGSATFRCGAVTAVFGLFLLFPCVDWQVDHTSAKCRRLSCPFDTSSPSAAGCWWTWSLESDRPGTTSALSDGSQRRRSDGGSVETITEGPWGIRIWVLVYKSSVCLVALSGLTASSRLLGCGRMNLDHQSPEQVVGSSRRSCSFTFLLPHQLKEVHKDSATWKLRCWRGTNKPFFSVFYRSRLLPAANCRFNKNIFNCQRFVQNRHHLLTRGTSMFHL